MAPNEEPDIEILARDWLSAQESFDSNDELNPPSVDLVISFTADERFQELWEFIKAAYVLAASDSAFGCLAAGPLEDLLAYAGEDYIDEVEALAKRDARFNDLLGGVWKNAMSEAVWSRVQSVRERVW